MTLVDAHPDPVPSRPSLALVIPDPRPPVVAPLVPPADPGPVGDPVVPDLVRLAALLLVDHPGAIGRLTRGHTRTRDGRCAAHVEVRAPWPCYAVLVADEVGRLRRRRPAHARARG